MLALATLQQRAACFIIDLPANSEFTRLAIDYKRRLLAMATVGAA